MEISTQKTRRILNTLGYLIPELELGFLELVRTQKKHEIISSKNVDFTSIVQTYKNEIIGNNHFEVNIKEDTFGSIEHGFGYLLYRIEDTRSIQNERLKEIRNFLPDLAGQLENRIKLFLYENVFNSIPLHIAFKDNDSVYQLASKVYNQSIKGSFTSIIGKSVSEIYPGEEHIVNELDLEALEKDMEIRKIVDVPSEYGYRQIDSIRVPVKSPMDTPLGVLSIGFDVSEQKQLRNRLEKVTQLQGTILEISKAFLDSSIDEFDQVMHSGLGILANVLQADRAYIFKYDFENDNMIATDEWNHSETKPLSDFVEPVRISDIYGDWVSPHILGQPVTEKEIYSLDPSGSLYNFFRRQNVKTLIAMPIFILNECYGFIGFDSVKGNKNWGALSNYIGFLPSLFGGEILRHSYERRILDEIEKTKRASSAKSDFLAVMSHEIRTPISGINNAFQILDNTELSSFQQEYLDISKYSLNSLSEIVNNILDYSKIEANKHEYKPSVIDLELEINKIVQSHIHILNEKDLEIYLDYDYSIPNRLEVDMGKLRQILVNLINNAIKFTPTGSVTISIMQSAISDNYAALEFMISDTGIGISEKHLNHLFDEFYQVDSSLSRTQVGTGLGLAICRKLVEFLGGELEVESEINEGSSFFFTLNINTNNKAKEITPIDKEALFVELERCNFNVESYLATIFKEVHFTKDLNDIHSYKTNKDLEYIIFSLKNDSFYNFERIFNEFELDQYKTIVFSQNHTLINKLTKDNTFDYVFRTPITRSRIMKLLSKQGSSTRKLNKDITTKYDCLLVEDNITNQKTMSVLLQQKGFNVRVASSGYEALDFCATRDFDIILMDLQMPGIDGYQTAQKIRQGFGVNADTPIIAVTANALPEHIEKALSVGMNDVVSKPFNLDLLLQKVELLLSGHKTIQEEIKEESSKEVFNSKKFETDFEEKEIQLDILQTFIDDAKEHRVLLEEAYNENRREDVRKITHYLKSTFGYMYADIMFESSIIMMDHIKKDDYEYVKQNFEQYLKDFDELINVSVEYQKELKNDV